MLNPPDNNYEVIQVATPLVKLKLIGKLETWIIDTYYQYIYDHSNKCQTDLRTHAQMMELLLHVRKKKGDNRASNREWEIGNREWEKRW